MWLALIPAASSSSSLVPDPGISRHGEMGDGQLGAPGAGQGVEDGRPEAALGVVVFGERPAVPRWPRRAAVRVAVSIGLTEYRSMTRALMPSSRSWSAAARQACRVTPAPTRVTWSSSAERSTLEPPTGNDSPAS